MPCTYEIKIIRFIDGHMNFVLKKVFIIKKNDCSNSNSDAFNKIRILFVSTRKRMSYVLPEMISFMQIFITFNMISCRKMLTYIASKHMY